MGLELQYWVFEKGLGLCVLLIFLSGFLRTKPRERVGLVEEERIVEDPASILCSRVVILCYNL